MPDRATTPTAETIAAASDPTIPLSSFRLLDTYTATLEDAHVTTVKKQLQTALKQFAALDGHTVTVGRIPPSVEMRGDPLARAHPYNHLIMLPTGKAPTNMTVWHELAHCAIYQRYQDGEDVPRTSENYTSLYAVARMEPDWIFEDYIPYYGEPEVPKEEWPEVAQRALRYRAENGANSHYRQKAVEWFDI